MVGQVVGAAMRLVLPVFPARSMNQEFQGKVVLVCSESGPARSAGLDFLRKLLLVLCLPY